MPNPRVGTRRAAVWTGCLVEAALLVTSGFIHLHLQRTAYQHVKTIGPLFIVQFIACLVIAGAVLVTRHLLAVVAGVLLLTGTVVGFVVVRTVGLFGFTLPYSTTLANQVLVVEIAGMVVGSATAWVMARRRAS